MTDSIMSTDRKILKKTLIILSYFVIWQVLSLIADSWLFPGPVETIKAAGVMLLEKSFYISVLASLARILLGLLASLAAAAAAACLAYKCRAVGEYISPLVHFASSVPVACLAVIVIILFSGNALAFFVVLFIVFPVAYTQLLALLDSVDIKMLEMAKVYDFTLGMRARCIFLPHIREGFKKTIELCTGMCFKAGIAAEVIGMVRNSIGGELYKTKLYFETDRLFAWIFFIMIVSFAALRLISLLYTAITGTLMKCPAAGKKAVDTSADIALKNVSMSFKDQKVIDSLDLNVTDPGIYFVFGPPGRGKTTLLGIIAGIIKPTGGTASKVSCSYAFQETRLISHLSVSDNLKLAGIEKGDLDLPAGFADEEYLNKKTGSLSGGEKRKAELLRALFSGRKYILLDEPFTWLDEEGKKEVSGIIRKKAKDAAVIISIHEEGSAPCLTGITLFK